MGTGGKVCTRCGEHRALEDFPPNPRMADGRDSWCRDCRRTYDRARAERRRRAAGMAERPTYVDPEGHKTCRRCGQLLPASSYWRDRANPDGLSSWCKDCKRPAGTVARPPVEDVPEGMRRCSACRDLVMLEEFRGRSARCRECVNAAARARYVPKGAPRLEVPDGHKFCARCGEVLEVDAFHRNRARADGLDTYCRACSGARRGHVPRFVDPATEGHKTCRTCTEVKPLADFRADPRAERGVEATCRPCRRDQQERLRRERGIPERPQFDDPEGHKTCRRCGELKPLSVYGPEPRNRDGLRSWCDPCQRARTLEWHRANPVTMSRLRAVRRGVEDAGLVLEVDWTAMCRHYGHACAYCRTYTPRPAVEHVVPVTRGGRHYIGNLLPVCQGCNSSKGNRLLVEWRYRPRNRARLVLNARPANPPWLP